MVLGSSPIAALGSRTRKYPSRNPSRGGAGVSGSFSAPWGAWGALTGDHAGVGDPREAVQGVPLGIFALHLQQKVARGDTEWGAHPELPRGGVGEGPCRQREECMTRGVEELDLLQAPRRLQTGAVHHHGNGQTWREGRKETIQPHSWLREAQTQHPCPGAAPASPCTGRSLGWLASNSGWVEKLA